MGLYSVTVCYNARQDNTISTVQYSTKQYNNTYQTKQHTTLEATLNAQNWQLSIRKIGNPKCAKLATLNTQNWQHSMRKIGNSQYAKLTTLNAQNWQLSMRKIGNSQYSKFLSTPKIAVTHTGSVSFIFCCGI